MNSRRSFLAVVCGVCSGAVTIVGSGAFSATRVERGVNVEVVTDEEGYLKMVPLGDDRRSSSNGMIKFQFPDDDESVPGLNPDAVYHFAGEITDQQRSGLLQIQNEAKHEEVVWVYSEQLEKDGKPDVNLFEVVEDDGNYVRGRDLDHAEEDSAVELGPGESFLAGIRINTYGVSARPDEAYETTLRVRAETDINE